MRCEGGASVPSLLNEYVMDEASKSLWAKVCETVNRLGQPRSPRVRPTLEVYNPSTIDLHGMTIQEAYFFTIDFLKNTPHKTVTVITGKSGDICREFPMWLNRVPSVRTFIELNGGGAFEVRLTRA